MFWHLIMLFLVALASVSPDAGATSDRERAPRIPFGDLSVADSSAHLDDAGTDLYFEQQQASLLHRMREYREVQRRQVWRKVRDTRRSYISPKQVIKNFWDNLSNHRSCPKFFNLPEQADFDLLRWAYDRLGRPEEGDQLSEPGSVSVWAAFTLPYQIQRDTRLDDDIERSTINHASECTKSFAWSSSGEPTEPWSKYHWLEFRMAEIEPVMGTFLRQFKIRFDIRLVDSDPVIQ